MAEGTLTAMMYKSIAISSYIVFLYWLSLHKPGLNMIFFPTLGAFALICISRTFDIVWLLKVSFGAVVSALIGSILYYVYPGVVSLLAATLITTWLILRFKWNAPPILAVCLIPFFSQAPTPWIVPLSVLGALIGLIVIVSSIRGFELLLIKSTPLFTKGRESGPNMTSHK